MYIGLFVLIENGRARRIYLAVSCIILRLPPLSTESLQDPSHIALEVAMQTHPNVVLLAEDVRAKRWSLHDIVREVCDVIQARSAAGKQFGAVLVRIVLMRVSLTETRSYGGRWCPEVAYAMWDQGPSLSLLKACITRR